MSAKQLTPEEEAEWRNLHAGWVRHGVDSPTWMRHEIDRIWATLDAERARAPEADAEREMQIVAAQRSEREHDAAIAERDEARRDIAAHVAERDALRTDHAKMERKRKHAVDCLAIEREERSKLWAERAKLVAALKRIEQLTWCEDNGATPDAAVDAIHTVAYEALAELGDLS